MGKFFNELSDQLDIYLHQYASTIIMGDFNCNLNTQNPQGDKLLSFLSAFSIRLIPTGCSYHTEGYDSWLYIIANNSLHLIKDFSRSAIPFANGHDLLNFEIQFLNNKTEQGNFNHLAEFIGTTSAFAWI